MADYNYSVIDFILDLSIEKNKKFFEEIKKKEIEDEAISELENLFFKEQKVEIEWLDISEIKEKNECVISMNLSYKYEIPKKYITAFHEKFNCKITGSSSTYDSDYTIICINEKTGKLQFNEYTDNESYIMRVLIDDDAEYYVDSEDLLNNLITFKNKKIITPDEGFYDLLLKQNKENIIYLLSNKTGVKKRYSVFFNELSDNDKEFLKKHNIKLEGFMIFKGDEIDIQNYLENMNIYMPLAFVGDEKDVAKFF